MKFFKNTLLIAISVLFMQSFTTLPSVENKKETVDAKSSTVIWKGYKVIGSHEGQISISNGFLEFDNGSLSGGEFTIDMSSIICTDLEGEYKGKLEGHLMAPDFFDVANHSTATLTITEVAVGRSQNTYHITADMTIKDITKSIEFNAVVGEESATASIKVDRTAYGIKYGSGSFFDGLGDNMIYNEFDLEVSLKF